MPLTLLPVPPPGLKKLSTPLHCVNGRYHLCKYCSYYEFVLIVEDFLRLTGSIKYTFGDCMAL